MATLGVTERLFALRAAPPFDRLRDSELALLAAVAQVRSYDPGETVLAEGKPLHHLFVVVEGEIRTAAGEPVPPVFGEASLLFQLPLARALVAAPGTGATCLLIGRAHFFTAAYECPGLVVGFLEQAGASDELHGGGAA